MQGLAEFIAGRSNKLLRDFIMAGFAIVAVSMGAFLTISTAVDSLRDSASLVSLPPKITRAQDRQEPQLTTITRSVLDDNLTTGSLSYRPIILDPCTGKEKK
jgi:hypothetical protein